MPIYRLCALTDGRIAFLREPVPVVEKAYNPDQPRDERGRFGEGNGTGPHGGKLVGTIKPSFEPGEHEWSVEEHVPTPKGVQSFSREQMQHARGLREASGKEVHIVGGAKEGGDAAVITHAGGITSTHEEAVSAMRSAYAEVSSSKKMETGDLEKTFTSPSSATSGIAAYSSNRNMAEMVPGENGIARLRRRKKAQKKLRMRNVTKATTVDELAHQASTSPFNLKPQPTERQKSAGNYPKGHVVIGGVRVSIENPAGSVRKPEYPTLSSHYGYVKGSEGADGDHVDAFVRVGTPFDYDGPVFVIDQLDNDGEFDEHKVMIGWPDEETASKAYLANYTPGWKGLGDVTRFDLSDFKDWLRDGDELVPVAAAAAD